MMIDIHATDSAVWLFVHGDASQQQFLRCDRKAQKMMLLTVGAHETFAPTTSTIWSQPL